MPTLNWIGKEKVVNHHQDVPYRILEHQYTYEGGKENKKGTSENKIIHGDNLEALKSLLPEFEGKIKCIYIDPPYNTGKEQWQYNDNVSHPKVQKWLGQIVGKESEDLSRHDKWLCMMYPRVKLLHKLLSDDGVIFVSLDDNEMVNAKMMFDEIFGLNNFIEIIIWKKRSGAPNDKIIGATHEYILLYAKNKKNTTLYRKSRSVEQTSRYSNPDNHPKGDWASDNLMANVKGGRYVESLYFPITNPNTGQEHYPSSKGNWRYNKDKIQELLNNDEIYFGKDGKGRPKLKRFLCNVQDGVPFSTSWDYLPYNNSASKDILEIFGTINEFDTPKPVKLIEEVLLLSTNKNDLILDSYAGSGTTAHAVLNLNKQDGGNRKFILVEMEEYSNKITAERIKRVTDGYVTIKIPVEGTGGTFSFYELGKPLFLDNELLNEEVGIDKIEEYVWYSETKSPFHKQEEAYLLGEKNSSAYYFYYDKGAMTTLDESFLIKLKTKAQQYIIYADNCLLSKDIMEKYNIVFKKIPRDITRF